VDIGLPQLSGVATSSRAGMKRSVKARPATRSPLGTSGFGPFIQQRRMPFFNSIVVIVALVTLCKISNSASLIVCLVDVFRSSTMCATIAARALECRGLLGVAQLRHSYSAQFHIRSASIRAFSVVKALFFQ
jgi:hypothetical protein